MAAATTSLTTPARAGARRLGRRRKALNAAQARTARAAGEVGRLDAELEANAGQASQLEAELAAARDRVAVLKKSIKGAGRRREKLRLGRKKARKVAAAARQREAETERRYDRAMLAELLRREKQRDLSRHGDPVDTARSPQGPSARL